MSAVLVAAVPAENNLPLTLDNCASEPIHTPGHTQPHGTLFAFDQQGVLRYRSANAASLLGESIPALGEALAASHFLGDESLHELIFSVRSSADSDVIPHVLEIYNEQGAFNVVAHRTVTGFICEFENIAETVAVPKNFSFTAHRATEKLRRQQTVDGLLNTAVEEVRRMTGFDRVMAYRFRHDDSGEVVAESLDVALDPFFGRRYPASDIPAQARRLYIINTLRLIADVAAAPVPVEVDALTTVALDMSYGVLRSVSPVHLEYLTNMGVGASMSVSIVIGGKLWGMLACHHRTPRRVAYTVRMACDVLAQILASHLQGTLARERASGADAAADLRSRLVEQVLHASDVILALSAEVEALREAFGAQGVILSDGGKLQVFGGLGMPSASALVQWLNASAPTAGRMIYMDSIASLPKYLHAQMQSWRGLLALPFGAESQGWVLLLRKEQVETVLWGGQPEKVYAVGPLGPRLSPRGSFDLWREIVRGRAVPWESTTLESAQKLLDELVRADAAHQLEISRARSQLLGMLGHDLRDPIQTISNATALLEKNGSDGRITRRLQSSSTRMQHLVGQVMDMSMMHNGSLSLSFNQLDMAATLGNNIAEMRSAYPGMEFMPVGLRQLFVEADGDRMSQVISNLMSNARHHGAPGEPVLLALSLCDGLVRFEVSNVGEPIAPALAATLFEPFKRINTQSPTNRNGLGLGLYIAHQIMAGHHGQLSYEYAEPYVVFTATFPQRQG